MMSLRDRIRDAYGIEGTYSMLTDVMGYLRPRLPNNTSHSLLQHLDLISGPHLDLDFILVGTEEFGSSERNHIDRSLAEARALFAPGGVGIKRIFHGGLTLAEADGYERIDDEKESKALRRDFSGPNARAVDVFFVLELNIGLARGIARVNPTRHLGCNKAIRNTVGCVLHVNQSDGVLLAHELGHHLTLEHTNAPLNIMSAGANGGSFTAGQFTDMINHCSMRGTG